MSIPVSGTSAVQTKPVEETGISMSHRDLTDGEGQPKGGILAWTPWSRSNAFATRRGSFLRRTGENGAWVLTRRLVFVLFTLVWLPAGVYASYTYLGVHYVSPVFFDELDRSGREAAAQGGKKLNGHMPNGSVGVEWPRVPALSQTSSLSTHAAPTSLLSAWQTRTNQLGTDRRSCLQACARRQPIGSGRTLHPRGPNAGQVRDDCLEYRPPCDPLDRRCNAASRASGGEPEREPR